MNEFHLYLFIGFFYFRAPYVQHHFSIETLTGVLRKAAQKRKYIRDEKTQDKLDLRSKDEASRSNSQASDAPSKLMIPAQSSTGIWKMLTFIFSY